MTGVRHILATLAALLIGSGAVLACEPMPKPAFWSDKAIKVAGDCSFTDAAETFDRFLEGGKAIDIGGGKVGQKIEDHYVCTTHESLLVVDCQTAMGIVIDGAVDPENDYDLGGGPARKIAMIQPPHGPVALTASVSVSELAFIAGKAGYAYKTDVANVLDVRKMRNRYDAFCGCMLFYPGSAGATK